jgi:DNA-binding transcriptional LysR family regulator
MLGALTLDQLRVLTTIADSGSFSAAGRTLRRVQSAISQSVRTLEAAQGVALFDRSSKTPVLTESGRVLVAQARQVLRQAELFESIAGEIAAGLEPELTLAMDSFMPTKPVIESLQALRQTYPNLPVTLFTEGLGAAERRLRNRSAALALCVMFPTALQEMQAYPLMSIALLPVASVSHPLASETRPITREVLQEHVQLILTDPYDASGPSHGVVSQRIWRFVDMGPRLDFLLAGSGWATMPAHIVGPYLADGRLVELVIKDPAVAPGFVPIFAAHERSRPPRPAARWLLGDLQGRLSQPALHHAATVSLSKPDPGSGARRRPKAVAVLQKR